jgi:putative nucleotidyltransferase with HDIG domain
MRSPGEEVARATPTTEQLARTAVGAEDLLHAACEHAQSGRTSEAVACFEAAILAAERRGDPAILSEGLRRLAVIRHQQSDVVAARSLAERSYSVARAASLGALAADALNTLGVQELLNGALGDARSTFLRALSMGDTRRELRARVEQNLGILANVQGDLDDALLHYRRSLSAYRECGDEHGCALAYHNLGMISVDQTQYDDAERHFDESRAIAERVGDAQLRATCLVSHAELDVTRQRYELARRKAEDALAVFDRLGIKRGKADAYRVIGMVYRETGRPALAEWRLSSALDLAVSSNAVLIEAETARELALLHQGLGRNEAALSLLNRAHQLFRRLDARVDVVNVASKMAALEGMYLTVVREWGESIDAADGTTFGHCARVAQRAVAMSRTLDLDAQDETTLLLGAYLHDVGMVKVPHEILHKTEPLTEDEERIVQMHPVWGIELLAEVEFPWPIKRIVRWHHEQCDGGGYPDRLTREHIPLAAQVVGILDTYDGLTSARWGREALAPGQAIWKIVERGAHWSPHVLDAFLKIVP